MLTPTSPLTLLTFPTNMEFCRSKIRTWSTNVKSSEILEFFESNSPWLLVSEELKVKLKAKPYDPKKSCWVPDKATHGYDEGLIDSTEGDKVTVILLKNKEVNFSCRFASL